jgi:protein-disulfide isomerase
MMRAARALEGSLAAAGLVLALATGGANAASPGEMAMGDPHAPVTVIEYASVGCPHCAVWANDVFPEFRRKYIDTGKVRFVFREMLTGNPELAALGFLTARCVAPDKYFQVVDDVFARQVDIGKNGIDVLADIAAHAGLNRDRFDACVTDGTALAALNARTLDDAKAHGVTGTPTFFVGDQKLDGEQSLEDLDAAIARARR